MHTGEKKLGLTQPSIVIDTLPYSFVGELQQKFTTKIFDPATDPSATDRLKTISQSWKDDGSITVFTSGVYDLLHLDHSGYLLHTKLSGVRQLYEREQYMKDWSTLESNRQQAFALSALSKGLLKLVVSVDGDKSVAERKGFQDNKGNCARPIYGWKTRALMVASQVVLNPSYLEDNPILPIVDAVTAHGRDDYPKNHYHADLFSLVEQLQPDAWAIFGESKDIIDGLNSYPSIGHIAVNIIRDGLGTHYYEDSLIGKMSTSKIAQRIIGDR